MKSILLAVVLVVLMNVVQSKVSHSFALESLIFRQESLPDDLEGMEEEKKDEMESAAQLCCYPKSFQATLNAYMPGSSVPKQARIFVDAGNNRLATIGSQQRHVLSCSCCTCTHTVIFDRIRLCTQRSIPRVSFDDLYDRCVPPTATNLGTDKMGMDRVQQQSSMTVQQWEFSVGNAHVRRLVTANGCLPLAEVVTHTSGPCQSEMINSYYFNMTSPVKDTSVFRIPSYCRRATTDEEAVGDEKPDFTPFYLRFN